MASGPSTSVALIENLSHHSDEKLVAVQTTASNLPIHGASTMSEANKHDSLGEGDWVVRKKISKLLEGREEEWTAVAQKAGPLRLLDLPIDILKEIVKEVTHTNDLTALALTHSALHNLAIPHIYSRFDIVWPDATTSNDSRTGVDALTYGLATLVMSPNVLGQSIAQPRHDEFTMCTKCGRDCGCVQRDGMRRLGNDYSRFTRKFSLGNGPAPWVQEYMITKESGKMLGTLVAVAIARMVNLETFIWDMPTGVLRDVWLALASLQYKSAPGQCRLDKVLVRWHDNSDEEQPIQTSSSSAAPFIPPGSTVTPVGIMLSSDVADSPVPVSQPGHISPANPNPSNAVECPTLSVLPPLKSLSVLDVDELSYLDEMSILIEKSKDGIRELRVGIAKKAQFKDFVLAWDGPELQQVDHEAKFPGRPSKIGDRRLGGVLGILLGRVFDIRKKSKLSVRTKNAQSTTGGTDPPPKTAACSNSSSLPPHIPQHGSSQEDGTPVLNSELAEDPSMEEINAASFVPQPVQHAYSLGFTPGSEAQLEEPPATETSSLPLPHSLTEHIPLVLPSLVTAGNSTGGQRRGKARSSTHKCSPTTTANEREHRQGVLKLQILELERVPLSIAVLQRAFDWSILTSLTILDCAYHEGLWRMLRRHFQPRPHGHAGLGSSAKATNSGALEYQLNLKKIHTDIATPALISFLKETLAPNTLEILFLQDRRKTTPSSVTIDAIYRGPLRRHRRSLKKLLIDSSDRLPRTPSNSGESSRWRTWMLTHDVMTFITGGNMTSLRELSVAIEYKDWHYFLRRLPQIPTLRSLNLPFIADHVTANYDPKELAMQVVDMIFLRPEIELCYLGISNKCFEILESRESDENNHPADNPTNTTSGATEHVSEEEEEEDDEDGSDGEGEEEDEDDTDDEDEGEDDGTATETVEAEINNYANFEPGDSDVESSDGSIEDRSKLTLRLREILFYDDRVQIFRARHMRL